MSARFFFLNSTTLPVWDKGEFNIWGENQYILYKQICFKLVIFLIVVKSLVFFNINDIDQCVLHIPHVIYYNDVHVESEQ